MRVSRALQFAAGIALAAVGLAIFFHNVDVHKLRGELLSCNPVTVAVCVACTVLTILLRALRWRVMLPDAQQAHKRNLFPIVAVGFMLNNILPARLGEAARVVLLWKKNGYRPVQSIGSIVMERIFDTLAFMTSFFIPVFLLDTIKTERVMGASGASKNLTLEAFAVLFCAIVVAACAMLFLYTRFPRWTARVAQAGLRVFPLSLQGKLRGIGIDVFSNLNWIFSLKKVAVVVAYTALMMLCYGVMVALITDRPGFTLLHGLFANSFAAMGAAIPLAPGFVGTLHAVLLQGLLFCGLPREKAIAVTLLYHAIPYCTVTLLGLFYFFRMRLTLKELTGKKISNDVEM
jgi:glycosyltransferase 2 family protein